VYSICKGLSHSNGSLWISAANGSGKEGAATLAEAANCGGEGAASQHNSANINLFVAPKPSADPVGAKWTARLFACLCDVTTAGQHASHAGNVMVVANAHSSYAAIPVC
jgi:hypothetical protein